MLSPTTPRQRKRLSRQIMRVIAVMECLTKNDASVATVAEYVSGRMPFSITERSVRRDIESLVDMGYVEKVVRMERGRNVGHGNYRRKRSHG